MTQKSRKSGKLLISYQTFNEVSTWIVARWLKEIAKRSGIDDIIFSAHSNRSASTSAAFAGCVQLTDILEIANRVNAITFYTFYRRDLSNQYSDAVLQTYTPIDQHEWCDKPATVGGSLDIYHIVPKEFQLCCDFELNIDCVFKFHCTCI